MLNMKKGLAIVLAAATALTFAPVSTLGLQGVVEAQAATVSAVTSFNTVADQQIFGTGSKTVTVTENVTGAKDDTDTLTVNSSNTAAVTVLPASATATVGADGKTATADITVTGVKAGTSTITVTSGKDSSKKISFNVTVRENGELLSGKIDDSVYAVSGQTYDLVANDTQIVYGGYDKIFSGKELTWYLTPASDNVGDDASMITTDKNIKGATFSESGVLAISNAADFKSYADTKTPYLFGVTTVNGKSTVVYKSDAAFKVTGAAEKVQSYDITSSCGVGKTAGDLTSSAFDNVRLPIGNGHYLTVADVTADSSATAKFDIPTKNSLFTVNGRDKSTAWDATSSALDINELKGGKADYSLLNGTTITLLKNATTAGTYKATATLNYKYKGTDYVAVFNITVTVGQGPKIKIADGANVYGSTYDDTTPSSDPTIYLDLKSNKTFDIAAHTVSDTANTTYSYDSNSANVTVDNKGVVTAKSVGTAAVTVKPTAAGVEGQAVTLSVRVNANGFDTLSVTGKDKDTAKVLSSKEFANNNVDTEEKLALRQISYVQIEVTGNESTNITEKPDVVSANKATLTYSFATQKSNDVKINPTTGEITIPYEEVRTNSRTSALGVYAVKVVSAATNTSAQTVSYYYVVVDYPDLSLAGVADEYTVGVCTADKTEGDPAIKFSVEESKNAIYAYAVDKKTDSFVGSDAYAKDDPSKFNLNFTPNKNEVYNATADGQIMHVLVSNRYDGTHGNTYKLVTLKSAPANDNYVTKIVNKDTGDVIYDYTKDATETAKKLIIEDTTNLQVTLHTPVAVSGSAVTLKVNRAPDNNGSVIDQDRYVTAVKNTNNIDVVLYPNQVGTQVISFAPAGHNSKTDRTDIHHAPTLLAVAYNGVVAPTKVTSVKVANKKGASVSVSWKSQGDKVFYRVYKKVGSGKWVAKNVKTNKTTLKVKKGAKVTVKVKAYKKTDAGKTVWGPKATKVTKKTDKK